ncbi:MAG: hypothetical protein ACPGO5_01285 [Patescibacteria group bacterium]
MSLAYFAQLLESDEHIQGVFYRSGKMILPRVVILTVLLWSALYWYFPLSNRFGDSFFWLVILLILIVVVLLVRSVLELRYSAWIVTSKRLIDVSQKGFLNYDISEEYIEDLYKPIVLYTSVWERIVGCGTVRVYLAHERAFLELSGVAHTGEVLQFLKNLLPDPDKIKRKIKKFQHEIGEEEFEEMLEEMSEQ